MNSQNSRLSNRCQCHRELLVRSSGENKWLKTGAEDSIEVAQMFVDHNYISNMNLELLAGKNFIEDPVQQEPRNRERSFFKNSSASKNRKQPSTRRICVDGNKEITIIGVVKDFHYADLQTPIQSFFFRYDPAQFNFANVKVVSTDMASTLAAMESSWEKIGGEKKFMARFFDDEIKEATPSISR